MVLTFDGQAALRKRRDGYASKIEQAKRHVERRRDDLHDYQRTALAFLKEHPFSGLFIDMGLGKTATTLTLIRDLLDGFDFNRVLVIAPLRVANTTWPNEIRAWEHTCLIPFSVITGTTKERKAACQSKAPIHITNRENVKWLVELWGKHWPYDVVVIDESSSFKDHTSFRFKALKQVRQGVKRTIKGIKHVVPLIRRLHLLTATPATETYEHLFAQIWLLDTGERLGKGITAYRDTYFQKSYDGYSYKPLRGAEEQIAEKISDIVLTMKREDYLEFQQPVFSQRRITLSSDEMAIYKKMERDYLLTFGDIEIEAETAAGVTNKLLQLASGFVYDADKHVHPVHRRKLDALNDLVEEAQSQSLLVSYHFKSSLSELQRAFPKAVVMDRDGKAVDAWNKGKIAMLLVHPQSAGHGLNLQKGGHHIVFFDLPWSLELYLQLIGRLDRQGQEHAVVVQHLVAENTIDEVVYKSLAAKRDAQEALFRYLKMLASKRQTVYRAPELSSGDDPSEQAFAVADPL